jgi:hypothetical protein
MGAPLRPHAYLGPRKNYRSACRLWPSCGATIASQSRATCWIRSASAGRFRDRLSNSFWLARPCRQIASMAWKASSVRLTPSGLAVNRDADVQARPAPQVRGIAVEGIE